MDKKLGHLGRQALHDEQSPYAKTTTRKKSEKENERKVKPKNESSGLPSTLPIKNRFEDRSEEKGAPKGNGKCKTFSKRDDDVSNEKLIRYCKKSDQQGDRVSESPKVGQRGSARSGSFGSYHGSGDRPEKPLRVPGSSTIRNRVPRSGILNPQLMKLVLEQKSSDSECFYDDRAIRNTQYARKSSSMLSEAKLASEEKWRNLVEEERMKPYGQHNSGSKHNPSTGH